MNKNVDKDDTSPNMIKRSSHRMPKNSTRSNRQFFIQLGIAGLVVMGYFVAMFAFSVQFIKNINLLTKEMNIAAQAESYYSFAFNV